MIIFSHKVRKAMQIILTILLYLQPDLKSTLINKSISPSALRFIDWSQLSQTCGQSLCVSSFVKQYTVYYILQIIISYYEYAI